MGKGENIMEDRTIFETHDSARVRTAFDADKEAVTNSEILFISTYPPKESGIAKYCQNLITALKNRFDNYFSLKVCAVESGTPRYYYPEEVKYVLNTSLPSEFVNIAESINQDNNILAVVIQHSIELYKANEQNLLHFMYTLSKPLTVAFHTVITKPDEHLKAYIQSIASFCESVIVMSQHAASVLAYDYNIPDSKIKIIRYGIPLVAPADKLALKDKYKFTGKKVLTTFGLLSPEKGIETTLEALPSVIKEYPEIIFLIIGQTHPEVLKTEGEKYRMMLELRVKSLKLQNSVKFLNCYMAENTLFDYLQLTDIYLYTSTNPNRSVSGSLSYAISSGCPIISTPGPLANEFLKENSGSIFNFNKSAELAERIVHILRNDELRKIHGENITKMAISYNWENCAMDHGLFFNTLTRHGKPLDFKLPPIKLDYLKKLTDRFGILQSSSMGEPDKMSGYTVDDNALALVVFCMHFKLTGDVTDITFIKKYLKVIYHCLQPSGTFLRYVGPEREFTAHNDDTDLQETLSKAIWAMGYLVSMKGLVPAEIIAIADSIMLKALTQLEVLSSANAIGFAMKGLYYYYSVDEGSENKVLIKSLADKLVKMYQERPNPEWKWFGDGFTCSGSVIPGALLNTWLLTGELVYREIAIEAFEFLSSKTFKNDIINTNTENWLGNGLPLEHPTDIGFYVLTLSKFYLICKNNEYFHRMNQAFDWFLGNNRLKKMMYNSATGSCFDGMEDNNIRISQSTLSALSYTMARLIVEKYKFKDENHIIF